MESQTFFALTPEGLQKVQIIASNPVDPRTLLRRVTPPSPQVVNNLSPKLRLGVASTYQILVERLDTIPINTVWEARVTDESGPHLVPAFDRETCPDGINFCADWSPQFPAYFATCLRDNLTAYSHYLFGKWRDKTVLLPLPNTFGDGTVCMGNHYSVDMSKTLSEIHDNGLQHVKNSNWNADLLGDAIPKMASLLMRFSPDGKQLLPPGNYAEELTNLLTPVSIAFLDGIEL